MFVLTCFASYKRVSDHIFIQFSFAMHNNRWFFACAFVLALASVECGAKKTAQRDADQLLAGDHFAAIMNSKPTLSDTDVIALFKLIL